jgi:hypothetical protein
VVVIDVATVGSTDRPFLRPYRATADLAASVHDVAMMEAYVVGTA